MSIGGSGVGSSTVAERFGSDRVGGHAVEGLAPLPSLQLPLYGSLPGRVTLTRASSGTFTNRSGLGQTVGNDVARFDYTPAGNALGFLTEDQRQNEALHNRDLTNAVWVKTNTTAAMDAVGYDGVANAASTLTATANNGTCFQTVTKVSAQNTYSVDIRRKTGSGTVEITDNGGTNFTDVTASINSTTYTRLSLTRTQANPEFGFRLGTNGDEIEVDFNQLEAGAFPSSRIATTTTAVTRAVDVGVITGSDFSDWYNATEGTFVIEAATIGNPSAIQRLLSIDDGGNNERINLFRLNANDLSLFCRAGGVEVVNISSIGNLTDEVFFKAAFAYKLNDWAACVDGGTVSTDTSATVPTVDRLRIGAWQNSTQYWSGHVRRITYYPARLSNAQLRAITS